MKQKNNQGDYDILYPKTLGSQVEGTIPSSQITGTFPSSSITGQFPASQIDDIYTKDQTLTQETAALFGLGSDATPDDAFKALNAEQFKVGDTLTTVRTDLGDKWLLCNGEFISTNDYPLLANILNNETIDRNLDSWNPGTTNGAYWVGSSILKVIYANGYYVACYCTDGEAGIFYSADLDGEWTKVQITTSVDTYNQGFIDFIYANGYYVLGIRNPSNGGIYYSSSLSGPWSSKGINNIYRINGLSYDEVNDYLFVTGHEGQSTRYPTICYVHPENIAGTWTKSRVWYGSIQGSPSNVIYANGYYMLVADDKLFYSKSLPNADGWSQAYVCGANPGVQLKIRIKKVGSNVYFCGRADSYKYMRIGRFSLEDLENPPSPNELLPSNKNFYIGKTNEDSPNIPTIFNSENLVLVIPTPQSASSSMTPVMLIDDSTGEILSDNVTFNMSISSDITVDSMDNITDTGKVIGYFRGYGLAYINSSEFIKAILPSISVDGAYVYIKAKE